MPFLWEDNTQAVKIPGRFVCSARRWSFGSSRLWRGLSTAGPAVRTPTTQRHQFGLCIRFVTFIPVRAFSIDQCVWIPCILLLIPRTWEVTMGNLQMTLCNKALGSPLGSDEYPPWCAHERGSSAVVEVAGNCMQAYSAY